MSTRGFKERGFDSQEEMDKEIERVLETYILEPDMKPYVENEWSKFVIDFTYPGPNTGLTPSEPKTPALQIQPPPAPRAKLEGPYPRLYPNVDSDTLTGIAYRALPEAKPPAEPPENLLERGWRWWTVPDPAAYQDAESYQDEIFDALSTAPESPLEIREAGTDRRLLSDEDVIEIMNTSLDQIKENIAHLPEDERDVYLQERRQEMFDIYNANRTPDGEVKEGWIDSFLDLFTGVPLTVGPAAAGLKSKTIETPFQRHQRLAELKEKGEEPGWVDWVLNDEAQGRTVESTTAQLLRATAGPGGYASGIAEGIANLMGLGEARGFSDAVYARIQEGEGLASGAEDATDWGVGKLTKRVTGEDNPNLLVMPAPLGINFIMGETSSELTEAWEDVAQKARDKGNEAEAAHADAMLHAMKKYPYVTLPDLGWWFGLGIEILIPIDLGAVSLTSKAGRWAANAKKPYQMVRGNRKWFVEEAELREVFKESRKLEQRLPDVNPDRAKEAFDEILNRRAAKFPKRYHSAEKASKEVVEAAKKGTFKSHLKAVQIEDMFNPKAVRLSELGKGLKALIRKGKDALGYNAVPGAPLVREFTTALKSRMGSIDDIYRSEIARATKNNGGDREAAFADVLINSFEGKAPWRPEDLAGADRLKAGVELMTNDFIATLFGAHADWSTVFGTPAGRTGGVDLGRIKDVHLLVGAGMEVPGSTLYSIRWKAVHTVFRERFPGRFPSHPKGVLEVYAATNKVFSNRTLGGIIDKVALEKFLDSPNGLRWLAARVTTKRKILETLTEHANQRTVFKTDRTIEVLSALFIQNKQLSLTKEVLREFEKYFPDMFPAAPWNRAPVLGDPHWALTNETVTSLRTVYKILEDARESFVAEVVDKFGLMKFPETLKDMLNKSFNWEDPPFRINLHRAILSDRAARLLDKDAVPTKTHAVIREKLYDLADDALKRWGGDVLERARHSKKTVDVPEAKKVKKKKVTRAKVSISAEALKLLKEAIRKGDHQRLREIFDDYFRMTKPPKKIIKIFEEPRQFKKAKVEVELLDLIETTAELASKRLLDESNWAIEIMDNYKIIPFYKTEAKRNKMYESIVALANVAEGAPTHALNELLNPPMLLDGIGPSPSKAELAGAINVKGFVDSLQAYKINREIGAVQMGDYFGETAEAIMEGAEKIPADNIRVSKFIADWITPASSPWEYTKNTLAGANNVARAGVLGGIALPNMGYQMVNYLTANAIIAATVGFKYMSTGLPIAYIFNLRNLEVMKYTYGRLIPWRGPLKNVDIVTTPAGVVYTAKRLSDLIISNSIGRTQTKTEISRNIIESFIRYAGTTTTGAKEIKVLKDFIKIHMNPIHEIGIWSQVANMMDVSFRTNVVIQALEEGLSEADALALGRKALFDYGRVSKFEQLSINRTIWFYTFMRENLATLFTNIINNPNRIAQQMKLGRGLPEYDDGDWLYHDDKKVYAESKPFLALAKEVGGSYYGSSIPTVEALQQTIEMIALSKALAPPPLGELELQDPIIYVGGKSNPLVRGVVTVGTGQEIKFGEAQEPSTYLDPRLIAWFQLNEGLWDSFRAFVNVEAVPRDQMKFNQTTYGGLQWRIPADDKTSRRIWWLLNELALGLGKQRLMREYGGTLRRWTANRERDNLGATIDLESYQGNFLRQLGIVKFHEESDVPSNLGARWDVAREIREVD